MSDANLSMFCMGFWQKTRDIEKREELRWGRRALRLANLQEVRSIYISSWTREIKSGRFGSMRSYRLF